MTEIPHAAGIAIGGGPEPADSLAWWNVRYTPAGSGPVQGWTAESSPSGQELLVRTQPPPAPPITTPPFKTYSVGDAVCNISLAEVNLRKTPGFVGKPADDVVALLPSKALLRLAEGPRDVDGLFWWRVEGTINGQGMNGWMAEVSTRGIRLLAPALFRDAIRLSNPFAGNQPVSQLWGSNADFYKQFTYDNVALRGHNGIDFAMPIGTPLLASDNGTITTVGAGTTGFGNYVIVNHRWGHSIYAHMNRVTVGEGQAVNRGDGLGESGNTGTSTGPHLHYSIRINPYFRADGWGGFCDPLPFMDFNNLTIPPGVRDGNAADAMPPSAPPIEEPGRPLP